MTTPNIKALAEQIKKNYEAQPDYGDPEYKPQLVVGFLELNAKQ